MEYGKRRESGKVEKGRTSRKLAPVKGDYNGKLPSFAPQQQPSPVVSYTFAAFSPSTPELQVACRCKVTTPTVR